MGGDPEKERAGILGPVEAGETAEYVSFHGEAGNRIADADMQQSSTIGGSFMGGQLSLDSERCVELTVGTDLMLSKLTTSDFC